MALKYETMTPDGEYGVDIYAFTEYEAMQSAKKLGYKILEVQNCDDGGLIIIEDEDS